MEKNKKENFKKENFKQVFNQLIEAYVDYIKYDIDRKSMITFFKLSIFGEGWAFLFVSTLMPFMILIGAGAPVIGGLGVLLAIVIIIIVVTVIQYHAYRDDSFSTLSEKDDEITKKLVELYKEYGKDLVNEALKDADETIKQELDKNFKVYFEDNNTNLGLDLFSKQVLARLQERVVTDKKAPKDKTDKTDKTDETDEIIIISECRRSEEFFSKEKELYKVIMNFKNSNKVNKLMTGKSSKATKDEVSKDEKGDFEIIFIKNK